jgi:hypothetical protein
MTNGVWWRGRAWRIGGASEGESEPPSGDGGPPAGGGEPTLTEALAAARAEGAQEAVVAAADREAALQARISELEGVQGQTATELELARQATATATERGLTAHRRALIAEHGTTAVHELIQGASEEALDASLELARAAFARIQAQLHTDAASAVPPGAPARTNQDLETLSPVAKIARGLAK